MVEKITFEEFDKLSLKPFAERLVSFVTTEHRFVEGALVVSLEAPFGSGKSTFLTMLSNLLDSYPQEEKPFALVVRLNAWESDFGEDPVLAIVSGITDAISATKADVDAGVVRKLKSAAGAVGRMLTSIGGDIVTEKLGVDIVKAGEYAQGKVPVADEAAARAWLAREGRTRATSVRVEPAQRLAFTRITKAQVAHPQILAAFEAVEEWIARAGLEQAGPCREVYFADWEAAGAGDPVCDVAFPVR